jgi:hypothetical protein
MYWLAESGRERFLKGTDLEIGMGESIKTRRLRGKNRSEQTTLDNLPEAPKKEPSKTVINKQKKQIVITKIDSVTKEGELALRIEFRLFPSKKFFSKIRANLFFDGQKVRSVSIIIPQSLLARDDFELTPVFDMKGITVGSHVIKVEMCELWDSREKFACASKEVKIAYVPLRREKQLIKLPTVKSIAGADLAVVSESEKDIYREIDENIRKEAVSKRDNW